MPGERGENFRVRDVLEVVMVLGDESIAERRGDENAGREVGGFENREAIAIGERVGVETGQKISFEFLRLFPCVEGGGNERG